MHDHLRSLLLSKLFSQCKQIIFKDSLSVSEDLCQDFKILSILLKTPEHLPFLQNSNPHLWLPPILFTIFNTFPDSQTPTVSTFIHSTELLQTFLDLLDAFPFIEEILFSNNGILKNLIRILNFYDDHPSTPSANIVISQCLCLIQKIFSKRSSNFPFIANLMQVLLSYLKSPLKSSEPVQLQVCNVLKAIIPYHFSIFSESLGPEIIIHTLQESFTHYPLYTLQAELISLLTLSLHSPQSIRFIQDLQILTSLKFVFINKLLNIYPAVLIFLNSLVNEIPSAVHEIMQNNLPVILSDSVEYFLPSDSVLIENLLKFLTVLSHNVEGCQIISSFSIVTRIIEALVGCTEGISNDLCVNVGESLQVLVAQVPAVIEKSVEGCVNVMAGIKVSTGEEFLTKVKNIGKIFRFCFCFTNDIVIEYFKRTCFDDILELIRIPSNTLLNKNIYRSLLLSLKHLPDSLLSDFLIKTIHSFFQILIQVQELTGLLYLITDFSGVSTQKEEFVQYLKSINTHIEVLRIIILSAGVSSNHYQEFSSCLVNLGFLVKILFYEFANVKFSQDRHPLVSLSFEDARTNEERIVLELVLSISKLFSSCSQGCCMKPQNNLIENSTFCILKSLGEILGNLLNQSQASGYDEKNNYVACIIINVVSSIIFKEKTFSISLLYSFYSALGIQNVYRILGDIKNCFRNNEIQDCYLLELWTSSLSLLKSLVTVKPHPNLKEHFLLMSLGCSDSELFIKELKTEAFFYFKQTGFEQSSPFYTQFKQIELDIIDYFIQNSESYFIENHEKNEHFYYHIEGKQKLCRSSIQNRGFLLKMETISADLIEILIEFPHLTQKISNILLNLAKTCEMVQQEILENLYKELQVAGLGICNDSQFDVKLLLGIIFAICHQGQCNSSYLVVYQNEIVDCVLGILGKILVCEENHEIFEGLLKVLADCVEKNKSSNLRILENLGLFMEKLDFQVSTKLFESISEIFLKVIESWEGSEKLSKKKMVKLFLHIKKLGLCKEGWKLFQNIILNLYESKQVREVYLCNAIRIYLGNKKVYLHNFLNNFSEDLMKHKECVLGVIFKCCQVSSNFIEFNKNLECNYLGNQKIIFETYKYLNKYPERIDPIIVINSITFILKKHPLASLEIVEFYNSKPFDFCNSIVSKRYKAELNNNQIEYSSNSFKIPESDFNSWLKTTFNFWKTLILLTPTEFSSKIFVELKEICESKNIFQDISVLRVVNYYIQTFIHSSDSNSSTFCNSLFGLYEKFGELLTKISLKAEISYYFFNTFLETFELIKSFSLTNLEDHAYEEEISENSESSEEEIEESSEKPEVSSQTSSQSSEELDENTSELSQDSYSSSAGSSFQITMNSSFQERILENTLTTLDYLQILEIEIKEHYAKNPPLQTPAKPSLPQYFPKETIQMHLPTLCSVLKTKIFKTLIKSLYIENAINENLVSLVLLQFSQDPDIGKQVVYTLAGQLVVDGLERKYRNKGEYLYSILTLRVLNILNHMSSLSPLIAIELILKSAGFTILLRLFQNPLFKNSSQHLLSLSRLFKTLTVKLGLQFPVLSKPAINSITQLLSSPLHPESTLMTLTDLIKVLANLPHNRDSTIKSISDSLKTVASTPNLFILHGNKQTHLLQMCKLLKSLGGKLDIIDFLWESLSDTLISNSHKSNLINFVPVIETFFICHLDRPNSASFQIFSLKTQKQINLLIKQHPSLLLTVFNYLVTRFPSLIDFENKRNYFRAEMRVVQNEAGQDVIRLHVRRQEVFMDSYHQLKDREPSGMYGKLRIQFINEEGLDAGGLTREWYGLLARAMFNANFALFIPSANGVSFQPNSMSSINTEHIQFFKFVGRIIGKALCDGYPLDLYFTRSFYKHILGQEVNYQDMEDLDLDFYKSLKSLMDINLNESELHEYYFAYEEEEFGKHKIKELVPGGKSKRVTEENKIDYIKLLCHMKMTKNIQAQIDAFKSGFHELIPIDLISIFDSKELELLISGLPEVDLEDLKNNTDYHNYSPDSMVIVWLWEVLDEFSHEERAEFIQFVTGSSKVPLEGFKALPGLGGTQKFQIHKSFTSDDRLPTAHTCMNQLDLPEYPTKEKLKNRLKLAISEGKEGFGFI